MTTFESVMVGDKVWCIHAGWGVVETTDTVSTYPVYVRFPDGRLKTYSWGGYHSVDDINPSLFWDEVKIEAPHKPIPYLEKDTKVLVWKGRHPKVKRYFSHFNHLGEIQCFVNGMTSWTTTVTTGWDSWELADDNN